MARFSAPLCKVRSEGLWRVSRLHRRGAKRQELRPPAAGGPHPSTALARQRKKAFPKGRLFTFVFGKSVHTEALFESVNTTAGIDKLLTTGVERMALGANLHMDILLGGTGLPHSAASASYSCGFVVRMNSFFHLCHLFLFIIV